MTAELCDFLRTSSISEIISYAKTKSKKVEKNYHVAFQIFLDLKKNDSKASEDLKLKSWVLASNIPFISKDLSWMNLLKLSSNTKADLLNNILNVESNHLKNSDDFFNLFLCEAIQKQDIAEVKSLLEKKGTAFIKQNNNTSLHVALQAESPSIEIIELLLKTGSPLDAMDESGSTPLHIALKAKSPSIEIIEFLLKGGSPLNAVDKSGNTPLHIALERQSPSLEIIKLLLSAIPPPALDIQNKQGDTALHFSCGYAPVDITKLLLCSVPQPSLEIKNKDGDTPLHVAFGSFETPETVSLLIEMGADPDQVDNQGFTCYYYADLVGFAIKSPSKKQAFSEEVEYRRMLAASWGIGHKNELDGHSIDYSGGSSPLALKYTLPLLKKFAEHPSQIFNLTDFVKLYEEGINHSNESVSTIQQKFKEGKTLVFMTGWDTHGVSVVIHDDYLIVCNRGEERKREPLKIYKIDRSKPLNEKAISFLQSKEPLDREQGVQFFYDELPKMISSDKKEEDYIVDLINRECCQTSQKTGNCWWIAPKAGMYALLALEGLLDASRKPYFDEISKEDVFLENFGLAQAVYKQFSQFTRLELLREYLARPSSIMERDYKLIEKIAVKLKSKKWKHIFEKEKISPASLQYWKSFLFDNTRDNYFRPFFTKDEINREVEAFLSGQH